MRVKFGASEQTQGLHLPAKFRLNVFIVSASGGQKPQFWANFDSFGGSCIDPLLPNFVPIGLFYCPLAAKNPNFCHILPYFWTSAFTGVANSQQSEKGEHGCTTTNLPLSNGIKIVSVLQRLHGEIGRTVSEVQKRDEPTNKQTSKQTKLDGCIVWNAHDTVLREEALLIYIVPVCYVKQVKPSNIIISLHRKFF